jgi:transposase-like protein
VHDQHITTSAGVASGIDMALCSCSKSVDRASSLRLHTEQSKYLNNLVEQNHRFLKRLVKPGMGFFSCEAAWRTLQGYEGRNMIRKGQVQGVRKGDSLRQAAFIAALFAVIT